MYNGKLITFEGIDGSGKTTQINLLKEYLLKLGYNIIVLREPGGTHVGEKIRDILLDEENKIVPVSEALLYAASRAELVSEIIIPSLKIGKIVILDRFVDSSIVYQGYARGIGIKAVEEINNIAISGLKPDLTIYLDIKPEEALKRINQRHDRDRLEMEDIDFHKKVYEGYKNLILSNPERFAVIDATCDVNVIQKNIINEIKKII
ncbi:dTMP kinase [Thermoanaerobacterium sp. RBIITD]|uniref:dTMP kinase n=1 Tax=Thermoanaerobacterium sp. RBIITD TaxID=1550240 RepID=UPI000BB7CBF3|nr:dTMP kinase [Thermoanaerobacterium sp. RBIITD]SNX53851.1 dTMP kinase [Thermoanaerobacterium sp. RBIITD]